MQYDEVYLDIDLAISQLGTLDTLKEMTEIMLSDGFAKIIPEINSQFEEQDWEKFKKLIHKFKSSCLYCATTPLLTLTNQLETLADSHDFQQISPVYSEFQKCAANTKGYIEKWLSSNF